MRRALLLLFALACFLLPPALARASDTMAGAQNVVVKKTDFKIRLLPTPKAGHVRFTVQNKGKTNHDLWIRGGGTTVHTKLLKPGKSAVHTTRLKQVVSDAVWYHFD